MKTNYTLDMGIFPPFGNDHDRNIAFCLDTEVYYVALGSGQIAGQSPKGIPSTTQFVAVKEKYLESGIRLQAITPPRITFEALADKSVWSAEMDVQKSIIKNMGEAGIPLLHIYVSGVQAPTDESERETYMKRLVDYYRELIDAAEEATVKVSTHHYHRPDRLLWNYETMNRVLSEVDSPYNGVTFCFGKSYMAGDDIETDIHSYKEKIIMVHLRDVQTRLPVGASREVEKRLAEIGYLEVQPGRGEIDLVVAVRALKEIGYKGQIYPEHYPAIAGDHAAGLAWVIGHFRALDSLISP
ncbi:TIM barrel protein [Candidatus Poribacteria bacterium]|nr:TIM barrel protein [Candidatus Poribacteria bacterium]